MTRAEMHKTLDKCDAVAIAPGWTLHSNGFDALWIMGGETKLQLRFADAARLHELLGIACTVLNEQIAQNAA